MVPSGAVNTAVASHWWERSPMFWAVAYVAMLFLRSVEVGGGGPRAPEGGVRGARPGLGGTRRKRGRCAEGGVARARDIRVPARGPPSPGGGSGEGGRLPVAGGEPVWGG
ncbi:hypothetical protein GCM10019017_10780 [Streptomyces showdoensis]